MDTTYGALFISLILSTGLYGITVLQTFFYYRQYPNDSRSMKSVVFLLWLLDTAHSILLSITLYTYLVSNFNNPKALSRPTWSMNLQIDCNVLIGFLVQCYFARRVQILSGSITFLIIIALLACVYGFLGIFFSVKGFLLKDYDNLPKLFWITATGLGSAAAGDIIIAAVLCYYLSKSRTGFAPTDSLITTLIMYCLATGLATGLMALLAVILFAVMPSNFIWVAVSWISGKCYVNSILVALNNRDSLRGKLAQQRNTLLHLSPFSASLSGGRDAGKPLSSGDMNKEYPDVGQLAVNVQIQTHSKTDHDHSSHCHRQV